MQVTRTHLLGMPMDRGQTGVPCCRPSNTLSSSERDAQRTGKLPREYEQGHMVDLGCMQNLVHQTLIRPGVGVRVGEYLLKAILTD